MKFSLSSPIAFDGEIITGDDHYYYQINDLTLNTQMKIPFFYKSNSRAGLMARSEKEKKKKS